MKGFTLIELLTVVIIIGVLASIALPQYQKAVEKSRLAEALTMGRNIIDSQNRLLDAFPDDNAGTRGALDIILSGGTWNSGGTIYTTDLYDYTLSDGGVTAKRRSGAFSYTLRFYNNKADLPNTCTGSSFCNNITEMGFTVQ